MYFFGYDIRGYSRFQAVRNEISKIHSDLVDIHIIHSAIGNITESDIELAKGCKGIILAYNVTSNSMDCFALLMNLDKINTIAKRQGVKIVKNKIIYSLIDGVYFVGIECDRRMQMKDTLSSILPQHEIEEVVGVAEVKRVCGYYEWDLWSVCIDIQSIK